MSYITRQQRVQTVKYYAIFYILKSSLSYVFYIFHILFVSSIMQYIFLNARERQQVPDASKWHSSTCMSYCARTCASYHPLKQTRMTYINLHVYLHICTNAYTCVSAHVQVSAVTHWTKQASRMHIDVCIYIIYIQMRTHSYTHVSIYM